MYVEPKTLSLEHSLISLSKWESKWNKPFLDRTDKTDEEILDYIKCMTVTRNVDPNIYLCLKKEDIEKINKYINAPMTATTFRNQGPKKYSREKVTSELIYYWMIAFRIPFECQKWHINRLITLIRVCDIKSRKPKKRSQRDILNEYAAINEARKAKHKMKG